MIRTTGVDIPAQSLGYQTFSTDCALDFSGTATKAYIATAVNDNIVYLQQVTKVPANTGLLLQGTESETIPVLTINDTDNVDNNLFICGNGTEVSQEPGFDKYVLAADDDNANVSFYLIGNIPAIIRNNQAYLKVASNAHAKRLIFSFDVPTAITSITNGKSQNAITYNMVGQRVDNPTRGLYIINNKKITIK